VEDWREQKGICVEFFEERQRRPKEAGMAGKKEAKLKASTCDRTEKNKGKSSRGMKSAPKGSGRGAAREAQQQPLQEQARVNPGADTRSQMENIKDGWEAMDGAPGGTVG
jgi:hypothetical protein